MEEKKEENEAAFQTDSRYAIVAGWLIIPAIMIFLNITLLILFIANVNPVYLETYGLILYIAIILMIFFYLYIAYVWVKRKQILPKLMIAAYIINILADLPAIFMEGEAPGASLLFSLIWIAYFIRSKRVKATFIK